MDGAVEIDDADIGLPPATDIDIVLPAATGGEEDKKPAASKQRPFRQPRLPKSNPADSFMAFMMHQMNADKESAAERHRIQEEEREERERRCKIEDNERRQNQFMMMAMMGKIFGTDMSQFVQPNSQPQPYSPAPSPATTTTTLRPMQSYSPPAPTPQEHHLSPPQAENNIEHIIVQVQDDDVSKISK